MSSPDTEYLFFIITKQREALFFQIEWSMCHVLSLSATTITFKRNSSFLGYFFLLIFSCIIASSTDSEDDDDFDDAPSDMPNSDDPSGCSYKDESMGKSDEYVKCGLIFFYPLTIGIHYF
jgi:hypothetical protein